MSNEIDAARTRLHAKLLEHTAGKLEPERVHKYTPTIIASPTIWIGQPSTGTVLAGSPGARVRIVRFGVHMVPDGYEPEQCALLDELVARVGDAIYNLSASEDLGAAPQNVDVGGTNVRCVVHDVAMTVFAHSFCPTTPPASTIKLLEEAAV